MCFVCKYPPIQGGVSMHVYWAARGLAERGHNVFVVTNANEVEETFRIEVPAEARAEGGAFAPSFEGSGGRVEVRSTTLPDRRHLYYIPMGNPTVSRLATMATDVVREHRCEVIFAYYLEPYGVAASLASHWTGIPYVFKHAGSDLNRLMALPDLHTGYLEVLARANRVISRGPSRRLLRSEGIVDDRIDSSVGFGLPRHCFNSAYAALDLDQLMRSCAPRLPPGDPELDMLRPLDPSLPVLGIYGKLGEFKGSFDVLYAIRRLVDDGFPLQLVALSRGWQETKFRELAEDLNIRHYIRVLPFIPHWEIPGFIRACGAVAFLERKFPIQAHTPTIPSEILSCGGCLIVSEEVLRKQLFRQSVRDRRNVVVVSDPEDHAELAACIRFALEDRERATAVGRAGVELVENAPTYERYIAALEMLLQTVAREAPVGSCLGPSAEASRPPLDPLDVVQRMYPCIHALLTSERRVSIQKALQGTGVGDDSEDHASLGVALGEKLGDMLCGDDPPTLLGEVCRYEYHLHKWSRFNETAAAKGCSPKGAFPSDAWRYRAVLEPPWEIQKYAYDVERVAELVDAGALAGCDGSDLSVPRTTYVLFREGSIPLRVSGPTVVLLATLAEGDTRLSDVLARLAAHYSVDDAMGRQHLTEEVMSVLEGLYWDGVLRLELPDVVDSPA